MEDKFLIGGLARASLAVILVLILPGPASPAPLALRVHVPVDRWRPVAVQPRPTFPAKPREQVNLSVPKPLDGDSGEIGGDDGDGDEPAWRLKFRGMDLPRQFGAYDLDHNRGVSLVELAAVTDTELRDAKEPFDAADLDGNKVLSQEEFTQAPWLFDAGGITLLDSAMDHGTEVEANDGGVETRQP
ncbi:uncharacterized protein LOC119737939 [Patiria miniata]|uniref:EF-hand domain-containing protein n=1 Tax=Patiria miniata TaxID=46514 RepID=A0A914AWQ5_PATMI|nr:uncharacterized protein LOC119737939 [Patiria miniata]